LLRGGEILGGNKELGKFVNGTGKRGKGPRRNPFGW